MYSLKQVPRYGETCIFLLASLMSQYYNLEATSPTNKNKSVMEDSNVASRGIVHELLTKDNYKKWKTLMKNYLLGKNLWWVVKGEADVENVYHRRKNAEALHIIQLSCGSKIFDQISECEKAKDAWNLLGARYDPDSKAEVDIEIGVVLDDTDRILYEVVEEGNLEGVKSLIRGNNGLNPLDSGRTVLHVATMAGHVNVVEVLVTRRGYDLVKVQDKEGYTALALAAHRTGNTDVAKCMVENKDGKVVHEELLGISIKNEDGTAIKTEIPLLLAADKGHKEMTRYLYQKTKDMLSGEQRVFLFQRCIKTEIFDVALNILVCDQEEGHQLANKSLPYGFPALRDLAQAPSAFLSSCQFGILQKIIYHILTFKGENNTASDKGHHKTNCSGRLLLEIAYVLVQIFKYFNICGIRKTYEQKRTHYQVQQILTHLQRSIKEFNRSQLDEASVYDAMLLAAKHGIVEFIESLTKANHVLLWAKDSRKRGIFAHAILCRKEKVFQLIHTLNGRKDILKSNKDVFGNNLLHLAGQLGPSSDLNDRPGAVLQMQREMQWFKAVEKIVHPKCKEEKNDDDKKPHEVFTEEHEELVKKGEKWAKETAGSFLLVGTLIITVIFAAAFTVPGGNDQNTGEPIFSRKTEFTTFIIADGISLFTSSTSVLIFIWIHTSRFAEKDFLISLPRKFLYGLVFLFSSVVSMLVAFCAVISMVLKKYDRSYRWLITGVIIFGCIPVLVLLPSQLRLIYYIFRSTRSNTIGYIKKEKKLLNVCINSCLLKGKKLYACISSCLLSCLLICYLLALF